MTIHVVWCWKLFFMNWFTRFQIFRFVINKLSSKRNVGAKVTLVIRKLFIELWKNGRQKNVERGDLDATLLASFCLDSYLLPERNYCSFNIKTNHSFMICCFCKKYSHLIELVLNVKVQHRLKYSNKTPCHLKM